VGRRPAALAPPPPGLRSESDGTDGGGPVRRRSWRGRGATPVEQRPHDHQRQVSGTAASFIITVVMNDCNIESKRKKLLKK